MKYTVVCMMLAGCGSITESLNVDSGQIDSLQPTADVGTGGVTTTGSGGSAGTGGTVQPGTGGMVAVDIGQLGTGGMQGTGGNVQSTGGSSGSGGSPANQACGLSLPACPDTVRSVYFAMKYADPSNINGSREARICAVDAKGVTVTNDVGTSNVRCGACAMGIAAGKRSVYSCIVKAGTTINVDRSLPVITYTDIYCLPINGVCPDVGVMYTKWDGHEFLDGDQ